MIKDDFVGSIFGEEGQLTVVGWDGERDKGGTKLYKIHCTECAEDPELFGGGYFYSTKSNLMLGWLPCGCSFNPRWTEDQYNIRVRRKCQEYGDLEFLGFNGNYKKANTKLKLQCSKHEEPYVYESNSIANLFTSQRGCHLCRNEKTKLTNSKPDKEVIESFFASGYFQEGTKFWRSERKTKQGSLSYWNYTCPVCSNDEYVRGGLCSGVFESYLGSLQIGQLSCRCALTYRWTQEQREYQINKRIKEDSLPYKFLGWIGVYKDSKSKFAYNCKEHGGQQVAVSMFLNSSNLCPQCSGRNQQECYINGVYDNNTIVAVKFGIANNSKKRVKQQSRLSIFDIRQLKVFTFPSVKDCKAAEKACKKELQCSILSKSEMPDGYTETTSPLNLDKIIKIYRSHGGIDK